MSEKGSATRSLYVEFIFFPPLSLLPRPHVDHGGNILLGYVLAPPSRILVAGDTHKNLSGLSPQRPLQLDLPALVVIVSRSQGRT
jgi:hypothetical protein